VGSSVFFSRDGRMIGSPDELWDVASGRRIKESPQPMGAFVNQGFSPDSRLAAWSEQGTVKFWDIAADRLVKTLKADDFPFFTLSPDGRSIVSQTWGGPTKFWDVATNRLVWTSKEAGDPIFSPDGRTIVLGI